MLRAVNSNASAATPSALSTTDELVKIVGFASLGGENISARALTH